jgi:hypothetical protein
MALRLNVDYTLEQTIKGSNSTTKLSLLKGLAGTSKEELRRFSEEFRLFHIAIAQDTLQSAMISGFFKTKPRTITDGVYDKPYQAVKIGGKIVFIEPMSESEIIRGIIDCYKLVARYSKRQTGQYARWNVVLHNGKQVAKNLPELEKWAKTSKIKGYDIVRIINLNAYARRLEYLGASNGGRRRIVKNTRSRKGENYRNNRIPMKNAPNGAYYLAHKQTYKKFEVMGGKNRKKGAGVKFEFLSGQGISGLPVIKSQRTTFSEKLWGKKRGNRPYLYPSIVFKIDPGGIA